MENNKIDILTEFIFGHDDIYSFVKKQYYKDMYNTIYAHYLSKLKSDDTIEKIMQIAFCIYQSQTKLNEALKIECPELDEYLICCISDEIYRAFPNAKELLKISKHHFQIRLKDGIHFTKLFIEEEKRISKLTKKRVKKHVI